MKRFILAVIVALVSASAFAQAIPVQQQATRPDACSTVNATAAVNNTATVTLTPPNGQYVYVCGIDLTVSDDATGAVAQTNVSFTSTNLGGWAYKYSFANAANTTLSQVFVFNVPLKSAVAGTVVTLVSPAINLHAAYSINAYYYFAP